LSVVIVAVNIEILLAGKRFKVIESNPYGFVLHYFKKKVGLYRREKIHLYSLDCLGKNNQAVTNANG